MLLKVYDIFTECSYGQKYCVVAESFAEAEKLWKEKYQSEIKEIRLHSEYVIVQGGKDE